MFKMKLSVFYVLLCKKYFILMKAHNNYTFIKIAHIKDFSGSTYISWNERGSCYFGQNERSTLFLLEMNIIYKVGVNEETMTGKS